MTSLLVYYAHPGHRHSTVNRAMAARAREVSGISFFDLYEAYPRFDIDVEAEQRRLVAHDVIVFQFPFFWYSTPSLIKEWEDLVLQHGFAYGASGDKLRGKRLMLAISAAGPTDAYRSQGYNNFPVRTLLTPLEQTANLCGMRFVAPYVLFASLKAPKLGRVEPHVAGYAALLEAIRDDRYDFAAVHDVDYVTHETLPILEVV